MNRALAFSLLGLAACASVLGIKKVSERRTFEHRAHVVEGVSCTRCHSSVAESEDDTPVQLPETALCLECHEKPHDARRCRNCHGLEDTDMRTEQARLHLSFEHRDHVRELDGNCARCHSAVSEDGSRLLPKMGECLGCHEHSSEFDRRACNRCHENLETEDSRPESHVVHGADFSRSHGAQASAQSDLCATCHSQTECASCHGATVPALSQRLDFVRARLEGIHRANFMSRHSLEAKSDPGLCATCHATDTCQRCHESSGVASKFEAVASPHPTGWVGLSSNLHGPAARRDPLSCASCHGGAGEMLCVSCHSVGGVGGNPHPAGWSSNKSKNDLPCNLCHASVR